MEVVLFIFVLICIAAGGILTLYSGLRGYTYACKHALAINSTRGFFRNAFGQMSGNVLVLLLIALTSVPICFLLAIVVVLRKVRNRSSELGTGHLVRGVVWMAFAALLTPICLFMLGILSTQAYLAINGGFLVPDDTWAGFTRDSVYRWWVYPVFVLVGGIMGLSGGGRPGGRLPNANEIEQGVSWSILFSGSEIYLQVQRDSIVLTNDSDKVLTEISVGIKLISAPLLGSEKTVLDEDYRWDAWAIDEKKKISVGASVVPASGLVVAVSGFAYTTLNGESNRVRIECTWAGA